MKKGFAMTASSDEPVRVSWPKSKDTPRNARTATHSQANGNQRRDGRCPSGNSCGKKRITGKMPTSHPSDDTSPVATTAGPSVMPSPTR